MSLCLCVTEMTSIKMLVLEYLPDYLAKNCKIKTPTIVTQKILKSSFL